MRMLKKIIAGLCLLLLIFIALSNLHMVSFNLLPFSLDYPALAPIEMPLFAIIGLSVLLGMLFGIIVEWAREHRFRQQNSQLKKDRAQLRKRIDNLSQQQRQDARKAGKNISAPSYSLAQQ